METFGRRSGPTGENGSQWGVLHRHELGQRDDHAGRRGSQSSFFVSDLPSLPSTAVLSSAEKLAAKLLEEADYPHASCLRPLRETRWPNQRIKRPSMKGSEKYQVLGQYSYGKFSRLTLATYRLPHTLQYLKHFVTTHGALGPRSSLAISRNATVEWSPTRTSTTWDRTSASPWAPSIGGEFWSECPDDGNIMPTESRPRRGHLRPQALRCSQPHHYRRRQGVPRSV